MHIESICLSDRLESDTILYSFNFVLCIFIDQILRTQKTPERKIRLSDAIDTIYHIVLDMTFGLTFLDTRNSKLQHCSCQLKVKQSSPGHPT